MYPPAFPSNDGHICARTQPAYSPLVAPRKQAEEKALTGMMRAQIARESEIRLLKCAINTQLGPNLLLPPFRKSQVTVLAIKFKACKCVDLFSRTEVD